MKGGFRNKVSDIDFKYTLSAERIFWVKTFYPILNSLVSNISEIDYASYRYSGDLNINVKIAELQQFELDDIQPVVFGEDNNTNIVGNIQDDMVQFTTDGLHYNFFGGIVYELLSDAYPLVQLSNYTDPTGDIDIKICVNQGIISSEREYGLKYEGDEVPMLNKSGMCNQLYNHAAEWIFHKLYIIAQTIPINETPFLVHFDIAEYGDYQYLSTVEVGNIHIVSFIERNAIKVQLVAKIDNGVTVCVDHLVEFLIVEQLGLINIPIERQTMIINDKRGNNLQIQDWYGLFVDNIEAYTRRAIYITDMVRGEYHKAINHTCRLLYLFELLKICRPQIDNQTVYLCIYRFTRTNSLGSSSSKTYAYYKVVNDNLTIVYIHMIHFLLAYGDVLDFYNARRQIKGVPKYHQIAVYNHINKLVIHNARSKSIPQLLLASISRRLSANGNGTCKRRKYKQKKHTKHTKR